MNFLSPYVIIPIIILIIIWGYFFNEETRIKRKIKRAPQKLIANFKDNDKAKIKGQICEIDKPLTSPLSNRECIGYHVIVQQKKRSGDTSSWDTIINDTIIKDFIVSDKGLNAIVRTNHVKSVIVKDQKLQSGFLNDATPQLESFLRKHGKESEGLLGFNKTLRYKEGILEKGELVSVLGKGTWKTTDELNIKLSTKKVLEITSDENDPVYICDHN